MEEGPKKLFIFKVIIIFFTIQCHSMTTHLEQRNKKVSPIFFSVCSAIKKKIEKSLRLQIFENSFFFLKSFPLPSSFAKMQLKINLKNPAKTENSTYAYVLFGKSTKEIACQNYHRNNTVLSLHRFIHLAYFISSFLPVSTEAVRGPCRLLYVLHFTLRKNSS